LILVNVGASENISCDTYDYTEAFPSIKIVFYEYDLPCGLPHPFTGGCYGNAGIRYCNGTTLVVFKPTSCATVCNLIRSLPNSPLRNIKAQLRRVARQITHRPAPAVASIGRLRIRFDGIFDEEDSAQLASQLKSLVDHRSFVVDLGDEPLDRLTSGTLERYLGIGNSHPHEEAWRMDVVSHSSGVPLFMTAVSPYSLKQANVPDLISPWFSLQPST
jgi:hypothetical protein